MNTADYVIIGIIVISALISLRRGFTVEAISLGTWIAAFVIARLFSIPFAVILADYIDTPSLRQPTAFVLLVVMTLIIGALIKHLFKDVIRASGLSATDRILGMGFGMARGAILIVVALSLARAQSTIPVNQDPWWQQSSLIPRFLLVEQWTAEQGRQLWDKLMHVSDPAEAS